MNKMIKVEIPEETARTVERLAREKGFNSVEAYIEALIHENLDVTSKEREAKLAALDAAIARGIADADAGRCASIDEVFDRLEKKFRDLALKAR